VAALVRPKEILNKIVIRIVNNFSWLVASELKVLKDRKMALQYKVGK